MQRGVMIYIGGTLLLALAVGAAVLALPPDPSWLRSIPVFLLMPAPIILALAAHRLGGESGNPFSGLVWGTPAWYLLAWLGGFVLATAAVALAIGLHFASYDPDLHGFVEIARRSAEEQGQPFPSEAVSATRIVGVVTAFASPTIMPWLITPLFCLFTFPWLGWLYRRLLPSGHAYGLTLLMLLWLISGTVSGGTENPYWEDTALWMRMLLSGLASAVAAPALVWLFLRTSSAVVPALALATYSSAMGGLAVFFGDAHPMLAPPYGALGSLVLLMAGVGLWVWKHPGGERLAVAAPLAPDAAGSAEPADALPG